MQEGAAQNPSSSTSSSVGETQGSEEAALVTHSQDALLQVCAKLDVVCW